MKNFYHALLRHLCSLTLLISLSAGASERTNWNFSGRPVDWGQPHGITLIQEKDSLLLDVYDPDSRIVARNLNIPCDKFTKLRITYRAAEFAGATNGELYYATDKFPEIEDRRAFRIPSLKADGKTHELTLDVSAWRGQGTVKLLRLDLVNQAPGLIYLEKLEFLEK